MSARRSAWPAFRALARTHLRLSLRGRASQAYAGRWAGKPAGVVWLVCLYAIVGGMTAVMRTHLEPFQYALLVHAATFLMVGLSLTTEAGDALFNPVEHDVLGHRPVSARTLLAAKVTGLLGFALLLAFSMNFFPLVGAARAAGASAWLPIVHGVGVVLLTCFAAAGVVLAYGAAARVVGPERFDNVAAWSQVALAIGFVGASQALTGLAQRLPTGPTAVQPWLFALPPAWFAALDALAGGTLEAPMVALAVVGVVATAAAGWMAVGRLGRDHAEALARVSDPGRARAVRLRPLPGLRGWWARWWVRDPIERAAFRLAIAYLRRDRETKLRLYPSLVVFALFPLTALANRDAPGTALVPLVAVCLLGMLPAVALESLRVSSHPQAAELFAVVPLAGTGLVFQGVRKASIWFVLPGLAVALVLSVAIVPQGLALGLVGLLALPTFTLVPGLFGDYLPLALPPLRGHQTRRNATLMLVSTGVLFLLLGVAWAAWRAGRVQYVVAAEAVVLAVVQRGLSWLIVRRPRRAAQV